MLQRTLEPEVMDSPEEAVDYDAMDHSEVNRVFVDDFTGALESEGVALDGAATGPSEILDVGTGTALVPIELCNRRVDCRVTAIDMAQHMLALARRNVESAGWTPRIVLDQVDAKQMPYAAGSFDAVISNSIVHHIPEPPLVLREMIRVLRPHGLLFVRDLLRPADIATVDRLVAQYAGDATDHQQQMFRDSLCAALTVAEIKQMAGDLGIAPDCVTQTTDRHWTLCWRGAATRE